MGSQSLEHDGDAVERTYAAFINSRLPGYATLWADFVGNDGASRLRPRKLEGEAERGMRERLSQRIYTVLESVLACRQLQKGTFVAIHGGAQQQADAALEISNKVMLFYAHLGRIRDNIERVGSDWAQHDLGNDLQSFYSERCIVLHGCKMPFGSYENCVTTVLPGAIKNNAIVWDDRTGVWSGIAPGDLLPLKDIISDTFTRLLPLLDRAFQRLYAAVAGKLVGPAWPDELPPDLSGVQTTVSGVMPSHH